MARKDILAAGGKKASYAVTGKVDDKVELKNVAPEGSFEEFKPEVTVDSTPKLKFIPTEGTLLVKQHEALSPSGLLIDPTEKDKPSEGIVIEVGAGSSITVGSHIVFGKYAGAQFKLNGEDYLLMEEDEIKGFLVPVVTPNTAPIEVTWPGIPRC